MSYNKIYPLKVLNNIYVKSGKQTIARRNQELVMTDNNNDILFDFTQKVQGIDTSLMQIYKNEDKYFVKINALDKFLGDSGNTLESNPTLKSIFEGKGLEIGKNAIEISQTGEEIIISIQSNDGKPYFIKVSPNNISLQYGIDMNMQSYNFYSENSNYINITMQRNVIEELLKSNGENSIFKPTNNIRKIPSTMLGLYLKGMENNSSITLGNYTLTNCVFSENSTPYCFIKQPKLNSKNDNETILFENGGYVRCFNNILAQYNELDGEKLHNLVISSASKTNPKYYAIPINFDDKTIVNQQFVDAFNLLSENTTLKTYGEELGKGEKINLVKLENDEKYSIEEINSFEKKDNRVYTPHYFTIKPKNYEIYNEEEYMPYFEIQNESDEPNISNEDNKSDNSDSITHSTQTSNAVIENYNENINDNSHNYVFNDSVNSQYYDDGQNTTNEQYNANTTLNNEYNYTNQENEINLNTQSQDSSASSQSPTENKSYHPLEDLFDEIAEGSGDSFVNSADYYPDSNSGNSNPNGDASSPNGDTTNPNGDDAGTGQPSENVQTPPNSDNGNSGNGPNNADNSNQSQSNSAGSANDSTIKPKQHVNRYLVRAKEYKDNAKEDKIELKKKNDKFKEGLKTFNTIMGDTLATTGFFMLITSLIPGVGLVTLIPALVVSAVGLFQTTFADKLVFNPYRKIKRKLKEYEDDQIEEFEYRDQFIENEHEIERLAEISNENVQTLNNLYSEQSENAVAREFAQLYNENGIGFVREREQVGIEQLNNFENLDNRVNMTEMLRQINNERNSQLRNNLINNFTNTFFQDLDEQKRQRINNMFSPENAVALNDFVNTLSTANESQMRERNLIDKQREEIKDADMYRLCYLTETEKLSDKEHLNFFRRYGKDIISNSILNQNSSTESMDSLINSAPEHLQDYITEILNEKALDLQFSTQQISEEAKKNVERKDELDTLKNYANIINQIEINENNFATMNDVTNLTEDYMNSYTLSYFNGYVDKLLKSVKINDLSDNKKLVPKYGLENKDENVLINTSLNNLIEQINDTSSITSRLAIIQHESLLHLKKSGLYKEIAELYTANQSEGSPILNSGGTLPNIIRQESLKEHTLQSIAEKLFRERIINMLSVNTNTNKESLVGKSSKQLLDEFQIKIDENSNTEISIQGKKFTGEYAQEMWETIKYLNTQSKYNDEKRKIINEFINSDLVDVVTRKNTKEPIVQYDENKKEFTVINYDVTLKEKKDDASFYQFKHFDEEKIVAQYNKKYPYFKQLSSQQQREFIMLKLGIDGQKARLESEQKASKGSIDKSEYKIKFALYDKLENMTNAVLSGKLSTALDELAVNKALDPQNLYDKKLPTLQNKGKRLDKTLKAYANFNQIISQLPLSQEQKRDLRDRAIRTHDVNNVPLFFSVKQELLPYLNQLNIDGMSIKDIINSNTQNINGKFRVDEKAIIDFCDDKSKLYDNRSQLNLNSSKYDLGQLLVSDIYSTSVKNAKNNVTQYTDYIEFFTENGFDENINASKLFYGVTTKEEHEKYVINAFASASSRKERNALIDGFVSRLGCEREFKQAKKNILSKNPQTVENKQYNSFVKENQEFEQAASSYYSNMSTLLARENLSISNNDDKRFYNSIFDKKTFKILGIDVDYIKSIIKSSEIKENAKRNMIISCLRKNDKIIDIKRAEIQENMAKMDNARFGITKEDRNARLARANAKKFSDNAKEFADKVQTIQEFLTKNPDYLYGQELVNAFVNGDSKFFALHPEFDRKGLNFGNLDKRLIDELKINTSKIIDTPNNFNIQGKSTKKVIKIKKQARSKNAQLLENLDKFSKGATSSLSKKEKKLYEELSKKVKDATKNKNKTNKIDLSQEKSSSILTSLKTLVRSFHKRHEGAERRIMEEIERQQAIENENQEVANEAEHE